eukprot:EG_transcript_490
MARPSPLLLLCLSLFLALGQPSFSGRIVFGQSASFTGSTAIAGSRLRAGLLAAFQEVNAQGGVLGKEVALVSADDQYNASLVPEVAATLLGTPDFLAFIGCYGSPTTEALLPLLRQYQVANVAPVTGSASFRVNFTPQLVHLRAGYNDENFAMLNFLLVELRVKRIGLLYQADSFGIPARDGILEALTYLGLAPARQQWYDRDADDVAAHDFAADAAQWAQVGTQAIILYGIGDWVLNTIRFTKTLYRSLGRSIAFVTCSFMGSALNLGLAAMGTDPANVFMTQVYPHPESSTLLATQYRNALLSLEGPSAQLEYLSLEGYAAGRFAIRVLQRMANLSRPGFLTAVNDVVMTRVADQLAGPFSSACPDATPTLSGARSSLCHCLQGFRSVELTAITANYSYAPIHALQYPISECYATPSSALDLPVIYAQAWPSGDAWAAARVRDFNRGILYAASSARPVRFVNASFGSSANATLQLAGLVGDSLVAAAAGCVNVPDVPLPFPVFSTLQSPAVLAAPYTESTLHLLPTLQQEIYAWATLVVRQSGSAHQCVVHVLYPANYDPSVVPLVQQSCAHLAGDRRTRVTSATYTGSFSPGAIETTLLPQATALFIFGLQARSDLPALVQVAQHLVEWQIFVPFTDVAMHWDSADPCHLATACDPAALARIHFATNLPNWKAANTNSSLLRAVRAAANASNVTAPEVLGYIVHTLLLDVMRRTSEVDPPAILRDWYYSAVHTVDDLAFGVYSNTACAAGECRCNKGAQAVALYAMGSFLLGDGLVAAALSIPCNLDYTVPVCVLDSDCQALGDVGASCLLAETTTQCSCSSGFAGSNCHPTASSSTPVIIGATVGGAGGAVLLALLGWLALRSRRNHANAPKDPTKPFCIAFTDIQASTHLWATIPEVMAFALNVHHELIRRQIVAQRCYEVKTIGDSFMCAAKTPAQALQLALAIQQEFLRYPWCHAIDDAYHQQLAFDEGLTQGGQWNGLRVRVGIHYGSGDIVLDPVTRSYDYYGTVVNTAARIESLCHGGQIGVSEAVYLAVKQSVADVEWTPLGPHTLRGLLEPVPLYQALPTACAARRFPPLRTRGQTSNPIDSSGSDFEVVIPGEEEGMRKESCSGTRSRGSLATTMLSDGRWADRHPLVCQGVTTADELRRHHAIVLTALQTLFATQTSRFQADTLRAVCQKLQVRNYGVEADNLLRTLHGVIQRLLPATLSRCDPSRFPATPLSPGLYRPQSSRAQPQSPYSPASPTFIPLQPIPEQPPGQSLQAVDL